MNTVRDLIKAISYFLQKNVYGYMDAHKYIHIYINAYGYIYKYIYMYIYIYTHIYINAYGYKLPWEKVYKLSEAHPSYSHSSTSN